MNLPAPERYAVDKLLVYGERPPGEHTKAVKDRLQAAALASWFPANGEARTFNKAWRDLNGRGRGWAGRAARGNAALLKLAPEWDVASLWRLPGEEAGGLK